MNMGPRAAMKSISLNKAQITVVPSVTGADSGEISETGEHAPYTGPVWYWTPSIAPSGMAFYQGTFFPNGKGFASWRIGKNPLRRVKLTTK